MFDAFKPAPEERRYILTQALGHTTHVSILRILCPVAAKTRDFRTLVELRAQRLASLPKCNLERTT